MPLPATTAYPAAQSLSPGGTPYYSELIFVAADTGLPWRIQVLGAPPALTLTAVPSCADIADSFATCEILANAVPSATALLSWGF